MSYQLYLSKGKIEVYIKQTHFIYFFSFIFEALHLSCILLTILICSLKFCVVIFRSTPLNLQNDFPFPCHVVSVHADLPYLLFLQIERVKEKSIQTL